MSQNGADNENVPLSFVDQFIDHYKEYESPTSFWRWSAYSIIAA